MGNKHEKQSLVYLLCTKCFNSVPIIDLYVEDDCSREDETSPKVRLTCNCSHSHGIPVVMTLNEYIERMKFKDILLIKCSKHKQTTPVCFCLNCERWLCSKCIQKYHTPEKCSERYKEVNYFPEKCPIHANANLNFYCKKCKELFCTLCSKKHQELMKSRHKIIKFTEYLTPERMTKKQNRFNLYCTEVMNQENACFEKLSNYLESNEGQRNIPNASEMLEALRKAQDKYTESNQLLIEFISIMFDNLNNKVNGKITNNRVLLNIVKLTSFNEKYDKDIMDFESITEETIKRFIHLISTKFLNIFLNIKLTKIASSTSDPDTISSLTSIDETRFASISNEYINIWREPCQKISTLSGHTNSLTTFCSINKDLLASGANDRTVKIWKLSTKENLKTISLTKNPERLYCTSIDPIQLACSFFGKEIQILDYEQETSIKSYQIPKNDEYFEVFLVMKNGNFILGKTDSLIILNKDLEQIKEVNNIGGTPNIFLELNDGNICVGFKEKVGIIIYDQEFKVIATLTGHKDTVTGLIQMNDNLLISSSNDTTLRFWDIKTTECIDFYKTEKSEIQSITKVKDDQFVTLFGEKEITAWKIEKF